MRLEPLSLSLPPPEALVTVYVYAVAYGWLCEVVDDCTGGACGAPYGHEPGCGLIPLFSLEDPS